MAARETFSSKLGTLMVLVGSAVGLGNIWRFPFLVGKYGAPFLLCYILCMLLLSIPILNCELILGRFSRSNKEWGRQTEIIPSTRNYEFAVQSHPAVLDGFISDFRSECQQRQMDHSVMQMSISM